MNELDFTALTPVEHYQNLYIKRDDLCAPNDGCGVNGSKLRECYYLIKKIAPDIHGIISGCSIHSPQAATVGYIAHGFGMPFTILVGGTTAQGIQRSLYLQLVLQWGGRIINCASGRHSVLYHQARKIAQSNGYYIVDYGINLKSDPGALFSSVSRQTENLPDELDKLFITCGSGITATGVLVGLHHYQKKVREIVLIGNAPNRSQSIKRRLAELAVAFNEPALANLEFTYYDPFSEKSFAYENQEYCQLCGIELHPNYEAKVWNYIIRKHLYNPSEKTLFWIIGGSLNLGRQYA